MMCPSCRAENSSDQSYCGVCGTRLQTGSRDADSAPTTYAGDSAELKTGTTFANRYQVIEELGRGGMGRVYKVLDTEIGERIALKLLKPELSADRDTLERFSTELKLARRITHRNVCRLYDLGRSGSLSYLTMEYVAGEDLRRLMRKVGIFGAGHVVRVARQICEGLAEAHRLGIVHRDLKPQNVMVDEDGNAKIMDFGIARLVRGKGITGAGVVVGTPQYMSPEQVDGPEVDQRSDIYSLGVILYEMATGRVPFDGDEPLAVAHKQKYETPADPKTLNPQLPTALCGLIVRCLAKDRAARYQSADEVRIDLDRIAQGLPTTEQAAAKKHVTSTQFTIPLGPRPLLAVSAALVIVAAGLFIWRPWSPKVPVSPKSGKPRVAVTWFDNQSERPDLDGVVVNLLTINLTRDDSLDVVGLQTRFSILRQLGQADAKTLDRAIATDIATRAEAGTMVTGSIIKLGDRVRIAVELVNVANGDVVAAFQEDGQKIDDVIPMVDRLTSQVRATLVGSRKASGPELKIGDVSTTSLDAFTHYQRGGDLLQRWRFPGAVKELEQAVAIDPSFAGAWVMLATARVGFTYGMSPFDDGTAGRTTFEQAKKLAGRATERERVQIDLMQALFDGLAPEEGIRRGEAAVARFPDDQFGNLSLIGWLSAAGDARRAVLAAERYLEVDPTDASAYNQLAYAQSALGNHAAAVSAAEQYLALHPDVGNAYDSAWEIYARAGQFDKALAITERWQQTRPESAGPNRAAGWTHLMRDDHDRARREILAAPGADPVTLVMDVGVTYLSEGRFREAEAACRKAVGLAEAVRKQADPASVNGLDGLRDAHFNLSRMLTVEGKTAEAVREAEAGVAVYVGRVTGQGRAYAVLGRYLAGMALVRQGDLPGALKKAAEIGDLTNQFNSAGRLLAYRDALIAEVAAAKRDTRTLEAALAARPRALFSGAEVSLPFWRPFLARLWTQGDFAQSITAVERFSSSIELSRYWPGTPFSFFYERSRVGYTLGRLYEQEGDTAQARERYGRFLKLMARADAGLPEVEDAKRRLASFGAR